MNIYEEQAQSTTPETFRSRIAKLQDAMRTAGIEAVVLESGPAMEYLTGVRWGKSERTFAVVLPMKGGPVWVLPGFEEMRARELIRLGNDDIRVWQEDESPYRLIVDGLQSRGVTAGRVGMDEAARFFVFDGIRKLARKLDFAGANAVLLSAGVNLTAGAGRGRGGR